MPRKSHRSFLKKKIVLFIVEGPSDKGALENVFRKIYRNNRIIHFEFIGGDISSDQKVCISNVCNKINEQVDYYLRSQKLIKTDLLQIIQIFDMDGAYISDEAIKSGNTPYFLYSLTDIRCNNCQRIKDRNKHKREIIDYLLNVNKIHSIPYEMYFVSSNLDHALYNEQNLDAEKKQEFADGFYERFLGKENQFIKFLETDVVNNTPGDCKSSWKYIREELHSLERHTNLHVYFKKHPPL
jgi:hypothetical protein